MLAWQHAITRQLRQFQLVMLAVVHAHLLIGMTI
jgi:hypothetical protein